jgi:hypothetical protein
VFDSPTATTRVAGRSPNGFYILICGGFESANYVKARYLNLFYQRFAAFSFSFGALMEEVLICLLFFRGGCTQKKYETAQIENDQLLGLLLAILCHH